MIKEFKQLVEAMKKQDDDYKYEDLEMLNYNMASFGEYVKTVYYQNYSMPIKYAMYEGEDLREAIENMDKSRRIKHEAAIAACSQINRECDRLNVPRFCPETDDRYIVADFCAQVSVEFFLDGIGKSVDTIDNVIKAMAKNGINVKIVDVTDADIKE